jgi:molybdate transport system substrate-binding protein
MKAVGALLLALAAMGSAVAGESVSVAAAADLAYCLDALDAGFAKVHPEVTVKVSTGSSGNFFSQIRNGAPFDVFLSADMSLPRELVKGGFAEAGSLTPYAVGRIVLWTTREGIDVSRGLAAVTGDEVHKLAIANPAHAPYGRAARAALEHGKLWEAVQSKLVLGENIAQTAQFVQTGNADAGIVALSLVLAPALAKVGHYAEIPTDFYPALEQGAVITKRGAANPAAARYLEFLRSADARRIFDRFGFRLPK